MPRTPNAIDFWRGFALVTIFINHIPGIYYERFTHRNFGLSDSAELFVFLAGWGLRFVVAQPSMANAPGLLLWRLGQRAVKIYIAQIFIISFAVAMLAAASILLDNSLIITWHNAEPVFYDPVRANVGLLMLTHHLGYFDILPLYVVLTMFAPVLVFTDRWVPWAVLPLALALYVFSLAYQVNLPSWPVEGQWMFNPLAWQLIFVLGFVLAKDPQSPGAGPSHFVTRHLKVLRIVSIPILIVSLLIIWNGWGPDPTKVPEPRLFFIDFKVYQTPMRLIQFLALAAVFSAVYPKLATWVPKCVAMLSLLGRNPLNVFCVGSLLSLAAQIIRYATEASVMVDTVLLVAGLALLALTAWLTEWPIRAKAGG